PLPGSQAHDEIFWSEERGYYRETHRAGGVEGGMTTGGPLVVRGAMKPLPTLTKPLRSVDTATKQPAQALRERTDSCTVPAAAVGEQALDSDAELEQILGEPIEAFFDREGEAEFRRREEQVVMDLLRRPDARVVALGGGALVSESVREALQAHTAVHLEVDV